MRQKWKGSWSLRSTSEKPRHTALCSHCIRQPHLVMQDGDLPME